MSSTKANPHASARVAAFDDSGVPTRVTDTSPLPVTSSGTTNVISTLNSRASATQTISKEFKSHIKIKALTDLWFRAKASASAAIEVSLDFYLVDADSEGA